jgi:hypothetical protein
MNEGEFQATRESVLALAEALQLPLLRLKLSSEKVGQESDIAIIAEHALRDIDAFITTVHDAYGQQLAMSTVSLGAVLHDVAAIVEPYARLNDVGVVIDDHAGHQPVVADARLLRLGYELVGKALCDLPCDAPNKQLILRADTRHGYPRLGAYHSDTHISAYDMTLVRKLFGSSRINAGQFHQAGALRIMVARRLLGSLGLRVRSAKSDGKFGVAMQLLPSIQLGMF